MRLQRRVHAGAAVCLLLLAYSTYTSVTYAWNRASGVTDPYAVTDALRRFAPIAAALPPGTRLGYISDLPESFPERATIFATARYAVAPVLLAPDPAAPMLLGDLKRPAEAQTFIQRERLQVYRDFGNGVYLFRRVER